MGPNDDQSLSDEDYLTPDEGPDPFLQVLTSRQKPQQPKFKLLPTEILQLILSRAPDAQTLQNLILSSPSFNRAFSAAQRLILNDVLVRQFRPRVLPDALATLHLIHRPPKDRHGVEDFLSQYTPDTNSAPKNWTLNDALDLHQIHETIEYFANDFISSLTTHPITGATLLEPIVLSLGERDRIYSTMYRFDLYCKCFSLSKLDSDERRELFIDKFSPWENEQLATIYEYLFGKLSIAFNDVARHDVEWGDWKIRFQDNSHAPHNYHQEFYLSLGLSHLRRLVNARTYEERYQMLHMRFEDRDFLWHALSAQDEFVEPGPHINLLIEEERKENLMPPFYDDPDEGPAKVWEWAYGNQDVPYIFFQREARQLRQRGFVMFDLERLQLWDIFEQPFEAPPIDCEGIRARRQEMMESWEKRSKIWDDGGRGRYAEDGSSKLKYTWDKFGTWKVKATPREVQGRKCSSRSLASLRDIETRQIESMGGGPIPSTLTSSKREEVNPGA